jgi:hypothetical protein
MPVSFLPNDSNPDAIPVNDEKPPFINPVPRYVDICARPFKNKPDSSPKITIAVDRDEPILSMKLLTCRAGLKLVGISCFSVLVYDV